MSAVTELKGVFATSWMKPQCYRGADIMDAILAEGLDAEEDGYYARLSADGYLDATDLAGPFASIEDAARYLIDTYGDEAEG